MLLLTNKPLPTEVSLLLEQYQTMVDAQPGFPERVKEGKKLFARYNTKTNPAFVVVREHLAAMSGVTIRCNYCEDSHANQIEHIYIPKITTRKSVSSGKIIAVPVAPAINRKAILSRYWKILPAGKSI